MKEVTIKDVANAAGVSPAAVSLAMRETGRLSQATRDRVRAVAKQLGYRANLNASILGSRNALEIVGSVPLAILRSGEGRYEYPIPSILEGVRAESRVLGYRLEEVSVPGEKDVRAVLRHLFHRGVQGVFVGPCGEGAEVGTGWEHFAVVALGRYHTSMPFHCVRREIFEDTRRLMLRMKARGYKRILPLLLRHDPPMQDDIAREAACVIEGSLSPVTAPEIICGDLEPVLHRERPDALISFSVASYFKLRDLGYRIPEDVGFATLHLGTDNVHRLDGFAPSDAEMGRRAVHFMDQMLRRGERGLAEAPGQYVIPAPLMSGQSLRALRGVNEAEPGVREEGVRKASGAR